MLNRVRVLVAEPEPALALETVVAELQGDERLEVVGRTHSLNQLSEEVSATQPQVVLLLTGLSAREELAAVRHLMATRPVPVVMGSQVPDLLQDPAFKAGAVSVAFPGGRALADQLVLMSQVKVIRRREPAHDRGEAARVGHYRVVGMVSSTGGPQVVVKLLEGLPEGFPAVLLLVQHIGAPFIPGFCAWLNTRSRLPVQLGEPGPVHPGRVYVAAPGRHMCFDGAGIVLDDGPPVEWQRPSGTVLLQSLAQNAGPVSIGMVLTGMGMDGAAGLLELRRAGGYTICQSPSSAILASMPEAALRAEAVQESIPAECLAARLRELVLGQKYPSGCPGHTP